MAIGNIPIIFAPITYALVPPLNEHVEDNSWISWACDTTYTKEGDFEKGVIFDNKESLLEAVRVYYIRLFHGNVAYRTKTSNQTILMLKCKRGCSWKLRTMLDSYSSSWHIVTYHGKYGSCVLGSDTMSAGHINLTFFRD